VGSTRSTKPILNRAAVPAHWPGDL